tara:strand:- start:1045 stop:1284 length:240 start_codon:yes stop_codon:yes gene_type:complete
MKFNCAYCDKPVETTTTPEGFFVADKCECQTDLYTENKIHVEYVKEYYLNSGFPEYDEEPFTSFTDSDWIDHANYCELD